MIKIRQLFLAPGSNLDLGISRFFFFFFTLLAFNFRGVEAEQFSHLPETIFHSSAFYKWLSLAPPTPENVGLLINLWLLTTLFSALGLFTRVSVLTSFVLAYYLLGLNWSFGDSHHRYHTLVICWGILAFSDCGRTFSLDNFLFKRTPSDQSEVVFLRLAQLSFCLTYFISAITKIRHSGFSFFTAENFQGNLVYSKHFIPLRFEFQKFLSDLFLDNNWLAGIAGSTGFLIELLCVLGFLLRSRLRFAFILALALLQSLIFLVMNINFGVIIIAFVFWVPWEKLFKKFSTVRTSG